MAQSAPKEGRKISVRLQKIEAHEVLSNNRLRILKTPLKDWLVCSECNHQQRHHSQNGGDIDQECWNCGASKASFLYMDELANELLPTAIIYRFQR